MTTLVRSRDPRTEAVASVEPDRSRTRPRSNPESRFETGRGGTSDITNRPNAVSTLKHTNSECHVQTLLPLSADCSARGSARLSLTSRVGVICMPLICLSGEPQCAKPNGSPRHYLVTSPGPPRSRRLRPARRPARRYPADRAAVAPAGVPRKTAPGGCQHPRRP